MKSKMLCCFAVCLLLLANAQGQYVVKNVSHLNFRVYPDFQKNIDALNPDYASLNACLFFVANEQRAKQHLQPLPWHIGLETMAFYHSKAMAQHHFFSHFNTTDSNFTSSEKRAIRAGIINPLVGECIAKISLTKNSIVEMCDEIVKLWMNSRGHRELILSENAYALGTAIFIDAKAELTATLNIQNYRVPVYNAETVKDVLPYNSWFISNDKE